MQIEPLGVFTVAIAIMGWLIGAPVLIAIFFVSTLLGASAAVTVTTLGAANIQPAYLLLGFISVFALTRARLRSAAMVPLAFPREGFWLVTTALYAVLSAAFLPRIFAGMTYVYSIARTEVGGGLLLMPLGPTTGNVTQTVYFVSDVVCFLVFAALARNPAGIKTIAMAGVICAAGNLVFAGLDLLTYWTGTASLLEFLRNANYRMLDDGAVGDFKRIVGSFPESSTFAYYTIGLFAFCTQLWLADVWRYVTGVIALMSFLALIFSTSSSGYFGLIAFILTMFLVCLGQVTTRPASRRIFAFVAMMPLLALALIVGLRLNDTGWRIAADLVEQTMVHKLNTQSGIERMRWNQQALINLADTDGLGAGVGSVRASSFPIAVLGNIGVVGGLLYVVFLSEILLRHRRGWVDPFPQACQSAARWACFGQLATAAVAGSFIDLGLLFFMFAGLSCASPELEFSSGSRRSATRELVA